MFGSQTLEVAIGVVFVFILISIICSVIREVLEAWVKTRAAFLEHGIRELLHDRPATGLAKSFYEHPLISGLFSGDYSPTTPARRPSWFTNGGTLPSYIPTKNFALALMDIVARGPKTDVLSSDPASPIISLDSLRQNVANLQNPAVQRVMLTALDAAQGDLSQVQALLEAWYDSGMDRVSGWYKRSSQWVIFWVGFLVAATLNVNPITIASYLSHDDAARAAVVARAEAAVKNSFVKADYDSAKTELNSLAIPIGWTTRRQALQDAIPPIAMNTAAFWLYILSSLGGWLITALAATLGAPFWFDVLNKIMVIRSTVKPHEKSPEEASDDRQLPAPPWAYDLGGALAVQPGANGILPKPPARSEPVIPTPLDAESDLDGCEVAVTSSTSDEDLPAAEGGVADL